MSSYSGPGTRGTMWWKTDRIPATLSLHFSGGGGEKERWAIHVVVVVLFLIYKQRLRFSVKTADQKKKKKAKHIYTISQTPLSQSKFSCTFLKRVNTDFSDSPVVKTRHFQFRGCSFDARSAGELRFPHATGVTANKKEEWIDDLVVDEEGRN